MTVTPRFGSKTIAGLALLILLALVATKARAESVVFGEYQVHYNVFPSTFLTPEVAAKNNLNRSRGIGVLNISMMQKDDSGILKAVGGQVEGKVLNNVQQPTFLAFRRIQEGDAVYFIAQFQYQEAEMLTYQIVARPNGASRELPVRFTHTLFND